MTIFEITHSIRSDSHQSRLSRLGQYIPIWLSELQNRRKIRSSIAKLSEKDLRDISLTRHDVQASCDLPLSRNAADELCKIAKTRAGNW